MFVARRQIVITLMSIAAMANCSLGAGGPPIVPHEMTQRYIATWVKVVTSNASEEEVARSIASLLASARQDKPRFIQQLLYHNATTNEPMAVPLTLRVVEWTRISEGELALVLAQFLYCEDEPIRRQARTMVMLSLGKGCRMGYPDVSHFRDYIIGNDEYKKSKGPLTRFVFERYPNASFLLLHTETRGAEMLSFRRAERVISNALYEKNYLDGIKGGKVDAPTTKVVNDLGHSEFWWARLFVAEIMVQHKEFRDDALVTKLSKDPNEFVRLTVVALKTNDPLRASKVDK